MGDTLGEFEQMVLLALLRRGGEAYGASLHEEILRSTGRDVAVPAIYVTLGRLEEKGLVSVRREPRVSIRGGHARKLFVLSDPGREALARTRAFLDRLWGDVDLRSAGGEA